MATNNVRMVILEVLAFLLAVFTLFSIAKADTTQEQLVQVMQENFAACNAENLDQLMATMSAEMPQRELFVQQTKAEWKASDLYYKLDGLKIVRQNQWRAPYAVATVRQTITGNEGQVEDPGLSNIMNLNTDTPSTEYELLFKREKGKWKVVAGLTEPRPVGSAMRTEASTKGPCANGKCNWVKVK